MIKYVKFTILALFLCLSRIASSADSMSIPMDENIPNDSIQTQETTPVLSKVQAQQPVGLKKQTKICKITSSASERWIKKNYKNCRKCGVYRKHSQKTYYCYCDCEDF